MEKEEERNLSKLQYKLVLISLKTIPYILALGYLIYTIAGFYEIDLIPLSYFVHLSVLPCLFILLASVAFKFCTYHRIPLYYIIVNDGINIYDSYIGIPISVMELFATHISLIGVFLILFIYYKLR